MSRATSAPESQQASGRVEASATETYRPPTVEVISLSCEISAYAPDEDDRPLF